MSGLTAFLDWLDEAAAGLIRIAYLLAGVTAVAVYFGAGHLPPAVEGALNGALPWALSFAVETHTYITARRVRAAWQDKQRDALKVNLAVLAGLLTFSAWNQLNYLYETWTPPHTALALPGWLAYVVRALVVPGAFMAAAFLAPLAQPVAAQIEAEARNVLADVFRIARKQRRRMLKQAEADGRDMTGALVQLVPDADLRRVISHAYSAIAAAPALATPLLEAPTSPNRPPTGPGSPVALPPNTDAASVSTMRQATIHALPAPKRAKGVRTPSTRTASAEAKVRRVWQPTMSVADLARAVRISRSAASKWAKVLRNEEKTEAAL